MHLLPLLGKQLKDDDVIDILESMEMDVIYDFDRLHEGQPDTYWAASRKAGIQLRFDAAQTLDTIFLYITPDNGFAAFSPRDCDVPVFTTATEVQAFGEAQRLQLSKGKTDFLGVSRDWIRLGFGSYSVHYELRAGSLALVTVSRSERWHTGNDTLAAYAKLATIFPSCLKHCKRANVKARGETQSAEPQVTDPLQTAWLPAPPAQAKRVFLPHFWKGPLDCWWVWKIHWLRRTEPTTAERISIATTRLGKPIQSIPQSILAAENQPVYKLTIKSEMQDIVKPLIESGTDVFWLGPASQSSIDKIEELLGLKLPVSLRNFLSEYGGGGVVGQEIGGIGADNPLLTHKGTLLGDSQRCRKDYRLPEHLVVVYFTDDGVCWCVDTSKQDKNGESPVVSYSIFTHKVDAEIAPTFADFLRKYVQLRAHRPI
jgi:antitoxin YobK